MYEISKYSYMKAKELGVTIKPSYKTTIRKLMSIKIIVK
jgi:hypothetical protein